MNKQLNNKLLTLHNSNTPGTNVTCKVLASVTPWVFSFLIASIYLKINNFLLKSIANKDKENSETN